MTQRILFTEQVQDTNNVSLPTLLSNISNVANQANAQFWNQDNTVLEPTGFQNRANSNISFNTSTRRFNISPNLAVSATFNVFVNGVRFTKSGNDSVVLSNANGSTFLYYDNTGTIQGLYLGTAGADQDVKMPGNAFISEIYWDNVAQNTIIFTDERHGLTMDWQTHQYLHLTFGTQYISGLSLQNFTTAGSGAANTDAQIGLTNGTIADEDIFFNILSGSPQTLTINATIPILYQIGPDGNWRKDPANLFTGNSFPVKFGSARIVYNSLSGTWSTPDIPNGNYVAMWLIATTDMVTPIIAILGQRQDTSILLAQNNNLYSGLDLTGLPFDEFRPLYRLIFQGSNSYSNSVKARLRDVLDIRALPASTTSYTGSLNAQITIQNAGSVVNSTSNLNFTTNTSNLSLIVTDDSANGAVNVWIDTKGASGGGANVVSTFANGTIIVANANINFNNTATVNVVAAANGTGQANISFVANVSGIAGSYLPLTGGSLTGNLNVGGSSLYANSANVVGLSYMDSAATRIVAPGGGSISTGAATQTGAIKIKLPVAKWNATTMFRFTVKIYQYLTGTSLTFDIGGYNYLANSWYNVFATQADDNAGVVKTVRWGSDATGDCIWIGELTDTWNYPQVWITDVQIGFNNADIGWASGWNVSWQTSFDTVALTQSASRFVNTNGTTLWNISAPMTLSTGTTLPLTLITSSSGPWAINLWRSDLAAGSRVYNGTGSQWYFEHLPSFAGATPLTSSNYNTYAPTLTGTGASGTWGINATGWAESLQNAAANTTLAYSTGSYCSWQVTGSRNSYSGINMGFSTAAYVMYDSSGNGGHYTGSAWAYYYLVSQSCLGLGGSTTASGYAAYTNGAHYVAGLIYATGNITSGSDRRLKKNIYTIDGALDKVSRLRGVYFTRKDDETNARQVGVIAQEVQEVLPEVVADNGQDSLSVSYGNMVGLLIEAIKELRAEVETLKRKV